jgi:hypothetical protein
MQWHNILLIERDVAARHGVLDRHRVSTSASRDGWERVRVWSDEISIGLENGLVLVGVQRLRRWKDVDETLLRVQLPLILLADRIVLCWESELYAPHERRQVTVSVLQLVRVKVVGLQRIVHIALEPGSVLKVVFIVSDWMCHFLLEI